MTDSTPTAVAAPPETAPLTLDAPRWAIDRGDDGRVVVRGAHTPAPEPADWRDRLAWFLRTIPGVQLVGAKRYFRDGHVFSMGENVVHPKGFHHLGKGVAGPCYRFPEEVDAIAGGVMLVDGEAFDAVDGERLLQEMGQLGALALGLAVRQRGGRVLGVPQVGVVDEFSPSLDDADSAAFRGRFGFDWVAPDLDVVRKEHAADAAGSGGAGGGLLWNAFHHAGMMPFNKYDTRGALVWQGYQSHDPLKRRCDHLAQLTARFATPPEAPADGGITLDVGCGDGLFSHLFAQLGCNVVGIDPEPEGVAQATRMCASQTYPDPNGAPEFRVGRGDDIPFDNATVACVTLFDVIEHLDNPVGVLREIDRVLMPGGTFICVTPAWQFGGNSDPTFHGYEFTQEELNRMINAPGSVAGDDAPHLKVVHNGTIGGVYRDLIAIAKKM